MTFPGGAPGGYPGQAPQQPHQPQQSRQPQQPYPGQAPSSGGGGLKLSLPQLLLLVTAGLGALNLFLGFTSLVEGSSFYQSPLSWVPALLLVAGLTAVLSLLPGDQEPGVWPAVFSVGATVPFLFAIFQLDGDLAVGGILVLVFAILQMLAAVAAYLFDVGIIPAPTPGAGQSGGLGFGPQAGPGGFGGPGQPGGYPGAAGPQSGHPGFGQPGQYQPGQHQPGQPGQPGQQGEQSGGIPQPTAIAHPVQPSGQGGQPAQQPGHQQAGQPGQPGQQGMPGQQGQQGQQPQAQAPTQYAATQGQFLGGQTPDAAPQWNDNPGEQQNS
ncbi:DUF5336 domain-containing protein [Saccharomonospora iraqiensis]|uniref:DUF5336 domain-containing protein n=1 Tax=Saccharomonospora iraqiensis TaxID=52698 RepID=UPI000406EB38|nr:DUF5336 domain-containing protein [Saccharomonospora iraqiensis]